MSRNRENIRSLLNFQKAFSKLLFLLALCSLPACQEHADKERVEVSSVSVDSVFLLHPKSGDTIPTGAEIPYEFRNVPFHPKAKKHTPKQKGDLMDTVSIPLRSNAGKLIPKKVAFVDSAAPIFVPYENDSIELPEVHVLSPERIRIDEPLETIAGRPKLSDNAQADIQILDKEQKLISSNIQDILCDSREYIWMASDRGLIRYDGIYFKNYTAETGLPSENVMALFEDSKHRLWIGFENGKFLCMDGTNYQLYDPSAYQDMRPVANFDEDSEGNIWILHSQIGATKLTSDSIVTIYHKPLLLSGRPNKLSVDNEDVIWISGMGKGLQRITPEGVYTYPHGNKNISRWQLSIKTDSKNRIWLGQWESRISYIQNDSVYHYELPDKQTLMISSIAEDSQGTIWQCSQGGGVISIDPTEFTYRQYTTKDGLPANDVNCVCEDPSGNIWIGTNGGGICRLNSNSFSYLTTANGLPSSEVYAISERQNGNMLLGTKSGFCELTDTSVIQYPSYTLPARKVRLGVKISEFEKINWSNGQDEVYAGSHNLGMWRLRNDSVSRFSDQARINNYVLALANDADTNLLVGTMNSQLIRITQNHEVLSFGAKEGMPLGSITDILIDSEQKIWLGSYNGCAVMTNESIQYLTTNEGLPGNQVNSIREDHFGNVWVCTDQGAAIVNQLNMTVIGQKDGLPDREVMDIIQDSNGKYWISTRNGMVVLRPKEKLSNNWNLQNYHLSVLQRNDGLISPSFTANSFFIDSKDNLWAGTVRGVVKKKLSRAEVNESPLKCMIETVRIEDEFMDFTAGLNEEKKLPETREGIEYTAALPFSNLPKDLVLPFSKNHLSFVLGGKNWASPFNLQYQYKVEGLDPDWSEPTESPIADYRNIPIGKHNFKARVINQAGLVSEEASFQFEILPPWWLTSWAKVTYVLLLVLLVILIIRVRTNRLRRKQLELEDEIHQATREIVSQKEELEETHREITDSIAYAKRIQTAILPSEKIWDSHLRDSFVLYLPKDIVAGDFFWMESFAEASDSKEFSSDGDSIHYAKDSDAKQFSSDGDSTHSAEASESKEFSRDGDSIHYAEDSESKEIKKGVLFAAADCTGHGVPGAMVSVICNNGLNRSVNEFGLTEPGHILDKTRELVIAEFQKSEEEVQDGMDISLCSLISPSKGSDKFILKYAGAHNALWIIRKETEESTAIETEFSAETKITQDGNYQLIEIKADKQPIGKYAKEHPFTTHTIELKSGDTIYLFSDGYADQFGGEKGKKFKTSNFKRLLLSIKDRPLSEQKIIIRENFEDWRGDHEQVDDVCIIGVRV